MTPPTSVRPLARAPSSLGVMVGALLLGESLRPSLLPRTLMTQIALSLLALVTGYAVGTAVGAIGRLLVRRITGHAEPPRVMLVIGRAGAVIAVAAAFASAPGLLQLQAEQQATLGLPVMVPNTGLVLLGATAGGVLMVLLGRGLRTAALTETRRQESVMRAAGTRGCRLSGSSTFPLAISLKASAE
jgi:uncharacterized membrane protein